MNVSGERMRPGLPAAGAAIGGTGVASVALFARFGPREASLGQIGRAAVVPALIGAGAGAAAMALADRLEPERRDNVVAGTALGAGVGIALGVGAMLLMRRDVMSSAGPDRAVWAARLVLGTIPPAVAGAAGMGAIMGASLNV
jgi:hypothetical protein